jgi:hypothetical protein
MSASSSMRSLKFSLLPLLLLALGALLGGCSITSQKDSSIPWNRPADWEGQIPGMGENNAH